MKRIVSLVLALLGVLTLFVLAPGASAASGPELPTLADLASMDADRAFTMEEVLALLQEAYALGYQDALRADGTPAAESRALPALDADAAPDYVLNTNSHKFHYPDCESVADMNPKNRKDFTGTREEVIAMGYVPCKRCRP